MSTQPNPFNRMSEGPEKSDSHTSGKDALFEQLIADFHERPLASPTHRETELPGLPGKIDAVIGMRLKPE